MHSLQLITLVWAIFLASSAVASQRYVYPVGNPNERPVDTKPPQRNIITDPSPNGFYVNQSHMDTNGFCHAGVDLVHDEGAVKTADAEIYPIHNGTVEGRRIGYGGGWGNALLLRHDSIPGGPFYTLYAHMQDEPEVGFHCAGGSNDSNSCAVDADCPFGSCVGDEVGTDRMIGKVGNTGNVQGRTGFHLHFAVKKTRGFGFGYMNICTDMVQEARRCSKNLRELCEVDSDCGTKLRCSNDRNQSCVIDSDCRDGGFCENLGVCNTVDSSVNYRDPLQFIEDHRESPTPTEPQPGPNIGDVISIPMLSGGMQGVAVESGGSTVLVAEGSGELSRVHLATGQVTTIAFVSTGGIASPAILPGGGSAIVITAPQAGNGASGLSRVNLSTGEVMTIIESGIDRGAALAIEAGANSALVTGAEGGLFRVNLTTGAISVISGIGGLGLAIESGGATALVATGIFGAGVVSCDLMRVDLATGAATSIATISCNNRPTGVAIEPGGATALVTTTQRFEGESGLIFRVDLASGAVTFLTGCPVCIWPHIVIEPSGSTALFLGDANESLIRLDRSTLTQTTLARSESPVGMAVAGDGATAFSVSHENFRRASKLSRINLSTGQVDRIAITGRSSGGVDLNEAETAAVVTALSDPVRFQTPTVQRIDLGTGVVTTVALLSDFGLGTAIEGSGSTALVVAGNGRSLLRIDLVSGNVSTVSDQLLSPVAVAIEQDQVSALVAEAGTFNNGSLARVDLQTGAVTRIATNLESVMNIALEPSGESALLAGGGTLLRVNLMTGVATPLALLVCGRSNGLSGVAVEAGGSTALLSHNVCGVLRVRVK